MTNSISCRAHPTHNFIHRRLIYLTILREDLITFSKNMCTWMICVTSLCVKFTVNLMEFIWGLLSLCRESQSVGTDFVVSVCLLWRGSCPVWTTYWFPRIFGPRGSIALTAKPSVLICVLGHEQPTLTRDNLHALYYSTNIRLHRYSTH
jgi:hypothetical protein